MDYLLYRQKLSSLKLNQSDPQDPLSTLVLRASALTNAEQPPSRTRFFVRASRKWNILSEKIRLENETLNKLKTLLIEYYEIALVHFYCPNDPTSFKTICIKCNTERLLETTISCCF